MKILKKVVIGKRFSTDEMNALKGGMEDNLNYAEDCSCSGNSQSFIFCNDNLNQNTSCTCYGNEENSNWYSGCHCGIK